MTLPPLLNTVTPAAAAESAASAGSAYTDIKGLEALKGDSKSPQAVARIAQQVEAMFLQMMLKSMREASLGDGIFDSEEGRMYQDMFDKQVALDMSQHQHVGISDLLMRQLSQKSTDAGLPADVVRPGAAASDALPPAAPAFALPGTAAPAGASLNSSATAAPRVVTDADAGAFVARVLPAIKQAARRIGVDPQALLAQAALETGWGQRIPRNADGSSSFNLFGIKAGENWPGARATAATVEFDGTVARRRQATFRSYGSVEESVNDFTQLVSTSPRYAEALAKGMDARAFVQSLAAAGYATDPQYASKVNQILDGERLQSVFPLRTAALQK
jgi:flagellar protein FlgJ